MIITKISNNNNTFDLQIVTEPLLLSLKMELSFKKRSALAVATTTTHTGVYYVVRNQNRTSNVL